MTDSSSCARSNRASPVGIASAVIVDSALRRRYPVSCALQVGDGVLPRLRPHACLARSLRRPSDADGRLELPPNRHRATPIIQGFPTKHIRRGFMSRFALILGCMELSGPPLVVAFELSEKRKATVADALAGASERPELVPAVVLNMRIGHRVPCSTRTTSASAMLTALQIAALPMLNLCLRGSSPS
jgi:hypothetical protein